VAVDLEKLLLIQEQMGLTQFSALSHQLAAVVVVARQQLQVALAAVEQVVPALLELADPELVIRVSLAEMVLSHLQILIWQAVAEVLA
jgi:hypothetical protein